eukprot:4506508-Amphidinium_carterae.1
MVARPLQIWLLHFMRHMESTKKWSGRKTFATVQTMVPEVFGELHPDSWRRWDEAKSIVKKKTRGRKAKVSPAALHELTLLAHQLASAGVPFSIDIFREINNQRLNLEMSRGWVHVFLLGAGLKCRSTMATDGRA